MTFDEAFREIGVAPDSSQDEIRRAYLRLVKTRKPEVDPEGFRRLREAYELLRHLPEVAPEIFFRSEPRFEPNIEQPAAPVVDAIIEDLKRKLSDISSPEERMALLRSAIDEHPQDPRLRWWLAEELHELGLQDDLQAFLRQCDRQGFPGFFESLVQSFPRSLGPEEIARIEQMDDPSAVAYAAAIWLSLGQTDRAVDTALRALARAEELGAFTHPFHIPLLVLRLQAQGLDGEAARVRERFQRFLHTSGQELALLTDRTAVLWQAAQEISRLSSEFPPPVRAAIADAVVTGSLADAVPPLRAVIAADGDAGWRMANELKELPVLHGLFHRAILEILAQRSPRPYQETSQETSSQLDRWFYLVFVCISAIALSGRYCSSPEPSAPAMPSPAMPSAPPILSIPLGPDLDGWRFGDLEDALVKACPSGAALTPGQSMLCNAAQDALASFRQGRCEAVRMTRFELLEGLQMVQGTAYEHTAKHLVALIRSKYVHACRDRTSWP